MSHFEKLQYYKLLVFPGIHLRILREETEILALLVRMQHVLYKQQFSSKVGGKIANVAPIREKWGR